MVTPRGYVDFALQRRALLAGVTAGKVAVSEVCEASPYLLRAAEFHGVRSDEACPVCRKENLIHVSWVYGDELGAAAGSARSQQELERLAEQMSEFSVYVVEVCRTCSWNHVIAAYVLGHQGESRTRRRRAAH